MLRGGRVTFASANIWVGLCGERLGERERVNVEENRWALAIASGQAQWPLAGRCFGPSPISDSHQPPPNATSSSRLRPRSTVHGRFFIFIIRLPLDAHAHVVEQPLLLPALHFPPCLVFILVLIDSTLPRSNVSILIHLGPFLLPGFPAPFLDPLLAAKSIVQGLMSIGQRFFSSCCTHVRSLPRFEKSPTLRPSDKRHILHHNSL